MTPAGCNRWHLSSSQAKAKIVLLTYLSEYGKYFRSSIATRIVLGKSLHLSKNSYIAHHTRVINAIR
ncbi:uncharacterized protein FOMMEDRAFT_152426 [Fomitiporia mediterranea MF3/22]|uniref:uncharacterized protein n=1 Tax=Fomitiporia mediterranea (strain MF3/22) TaxID=694068 RepID=UPI000440805A|nr:uncharacterized protein FOMMEDRAFT_152426 [Fomitiporia mediterranea MF3/22]EJD07074.1 hypothetical protein FOMMEDRAFT_152426 [Fomitiporia mediterranea MF3/22]